MNKTSRKTEPDFVVKSKPLSTEEKKKLSAIIAKSKQKTANKIIPAN